MTTSIFCYPTMRKTSSHPAVLLTLWWIAIMSLISCQPCQAQELTGGDGPEKMFQEAVDSYRQADYYRALIGFRGLLRDHSEHRRVTAALLMQAKCYFWLQNYDQAVESLQTLLGNYPESTYRDNAQYILGNCYYRQGHYWRSTDQLRQVIEISDSPKLADLARNGLRVLIEEALSVEQLNRLYDELPDDAVSPWILVEIARRQLVADRREEALVTAEQALLLSRQEEVALQAEIIRAAAQQKAPQSLTIGVICPLTGSYAPYGEQLRNGVQMAVAEHNSHGDIEVHLEVRDSQGSAVKAVEGTRDLIEGENAVAILGPLLSANAVGAGAMSDCRGVPLITPTAAEEEIAQVGRFVFQRSVGPVTMGQRMAAYAIEELELALFAVLAPRDVYGQAAVEGFLRKAGELGAPVLAVTWYQPGDTDFREQLTEIRRRKQARDDSLMALGLLSEVTHSSPQDTLPPEDQRVYLDGLFIPAAPPEAGMIAPQIAFHRLETLVLGTSGWGVREALRIGGQYMDGVHFATDFSEELSDRNYLNFVAGYRDRFGADPGKVSVFSYECAQLVLQGIQGGAQTREALYQFLAHTEDFTGLAGNISFTRGQGANDEIMIMTIQNGRILRLE